MTVWRHEMGSLTHQTNEASAPSLQRQLELSCYETTWTLLHQLRRAMVCPGPHRFHGMVEAHETCVGRTGKDVRGRETYTKFLVGVSAEEHGEEVGRLQLATLPNASSCSPRTSVEASIKAGARVHTDGWEGCRGLKRRRPR